MKILAIETSCDETAIAVISAEGDPRAKARIKVLSNIVLSQSKLHSEYGGVYPSLAKREHSKNLISVLKKALEESNFLKSKTEKNILLQSMSQKLQDILEREPELLKQFLKFIPTIKKPDIDVIVITYGPGLEPALWVGINFAKALGEVWNIPVSGVNHMEGHIFSALLEKKSVKEFSISNVQFPMLALLISGGHTELVLIKKWLQYEIIGETQDDAVGEAFDKVARMLGLPYPGGPAISLQAQRWHGKSSTKFPRPMLNSGDFNFSFSGLKTAVLYKLKKTPEFQPEADSPSAKTLELIQEFAHEFQEAAVDVLVSKTIAAAKKYEVKTIIVGGGVSANKRIREQLADEVSKKLPGTTLLLSPQELTGDNALMIATVGYVRAIFDKEHKKDIAANGNLRL